MSDRVDPQPATAQVAPDRSMEGEILALIAANAQRMQVLTISSAAIIAGILMLHLPWMVPAAWWVLLMVGLSIRTRVVAALSFDPARSDADKLRLLGATFPVMACVQSLLMLFFPFVPLGIGAMLSMYLITLCAGAVAALAGHRRIVVTYTCIVMGAVACVWGLTPDPARPPLERALFVLTILLFAKVLVDHADNARRVFADFYRIRSDRFELTAQLRDALAKAEGANRAKTRFLASASHDLRQPIHALSLFVGSLLMRDLDSRSKGIAVQIHKSVSVLASQLDALLDVSRLDAGVVEQSLATFDLHTLLGQLNAEFAPLAQPRGLSLTIDCPAGMHVRSDPMLLRRVLTNLLSNAIKYTASGGVQLRGERHGDSCRVLVSDTGVGIPEAEQGRVFEEFYQLENPERDRNKGLGLGLAIVRRLCELLMLDLRMTSTVGKGTEFSFEMPLAQRQDTPLIQADPEAPPVLRRIRVLVVDDEEDVRLGMQTLLEEMGFCVRVAGSTDAAVECTRSFEPALLLADLRLRGDDSGLRTVRALRQVWPNLPALLISGDTAPDRLREARDVGVELLHKPVQAGALREAILRVTA